MCGVTRSDLRHGMLRAWMLSVICIPLAASAQYPSFELGGLARGVSDVGFLTAEDTLARDVNVESHAIYDLALRGKITSKAEIYTELRLGTNLALFDTSASYAQVRRVLLSGQLTPRWNYEIGDIDVVGSPFTIWNSNAEGAVRESALFSQWRKLQNYENFSESNSWRLRGAKFEGNWLMKNGGQLKTSSFVSRIQASDEVLRPDVVFMGSTLSWEKNNVLAALSGQNFASLGKTVPDGVGSHVANLGGEVKWKGEEWLWHAEFGGSTATRLGLDGVPNAPNSPTEGGYWNVETQFDFGASWTASASARSVSDTYMAPAAQTKRPLFDAAPSSFAQIGNGAWNRPLSQGDLLTAPYVPRGSRPWNRAIQRELMTFDPRYGTANPYGMATPNRRGLEMELEHGKAEEPWSVIARLFALQDLTPEGTLTRRNYVGYAIAGHFDLAALWMGNRSLNMHGGMQSQRAQRPETVLDPVELTSSVFDFGVDWAVGENLQIGYGAKRISSHGLEYIAVRDINFEVTGFDRTTLDVTDMLHACGVSWKINNRTELTTQWQKWFLRDALQGHDGSISKVLFLFQSKF